MFPGGRVGLSGCFFEGAFFVAIASPLRVKLLNAPMFIPRCCFFLCTSFIVFEVIALVLLDAGGRDCRGPLSAPRPRDGICLPTFSNPD
jgi:hypothetical protein